MINAPFLHTVQTHIHYATDWRETWFSQTVRKDPTEMNRELKLTLRRSWDRPRPRIASLETRLPSRLNLNPSFPAQRLDPEQRRASGSAVCSVGENTSSRAADVWECDHGDGAEDLQELWRCPFNLCLKTQSVINISYRRDCQSAWCTGESVRPINKQCSTCTFIILKILRLNRPDAALYS